MSWILVSAYRKRNYFAVRIFNSAQTILNVWLPANYITNSAFVQDGCPDVISTADLRDVFQQRGKKEEKNAATFPPTCAAYIFPPEGSAGLILPTAVPMDRPSTPPGFSWTACRVYLASKQRTRLRRRSDSVNASRQSVCSGSSSRDTWRCGLSPCVNMPASETSEVFVRRNIISTTAAWREQWNKGKTCLRGSWLDRCLLWVQTSVLISKSDISKSNATLVDKKHSDTPSRSHPRYFFCLCSLNVPSRNEKCPSLTFSCSLCIAGILCRMHLWDESALRPLWCHKGHKNVSLSRNWGINLCIVWLVGLLHWT